MYTNQYLPVAKATAENAVPQTKMVLVDWVLQKAWDDRIAGSASVGNVQPEQPNVSLVRVLESYCDKLTGPVIL